MRRLNPFLIATLVALILYAATAAPSIFTFFDDSLELQLVAPSLGIAHPTGYPLYTLLGALWSRVLFPFGNWAWRMNIFSALTAACAVGLLFELAHRLLNAPGRLDHAKPTPLSWMGAGVAASALALLPIWWQQATVAEVYALHGLFVAAILLATLAVRSAAQEEKRMSLAISRLAFLIGLSLAHHRMTLLLLPGVALYLLWHVPVVFRPQRAWFTWLGALMAPLLLYLYIPLRASAGVLDLHGSYVNTLSGFSTHVNASTYSTFLGWNEAALGIFIQQFSWWGIFWGVVGGVAVLITPDRLTRSGPRSLIDVNGSGGRSEWLLIWITFLISLCFALFYNVADVAVFLIPAMFCWALFMGGGFWIVIVLAENLIRKGGNEESKRPSRLALLLYGIIAFFIGASPLLYNGPVNRSRAWQAHDQAVALAKVPFPPNSRVVGLEGEATAIKYMQQAEGLAASATALWANHPEARLALVEQLMDQKLPVYLTQEVAGIESRYSFSGEGPLIRVWPRGEVPPQQPQRPLDIAFADGTLWLDGVDVDILDEAGAPRLKIVYYWRPTAELTRRLKLSLRFHADGVAILDTDGNALVEDRFPLRQTTYSEFWVTGEQTRDVHYLDLPVGQLEEYANAIENLELDTILYDAATIEEVGRVSIRIN